MTYYNSIPLHALHDPRLSRRYTSADAPRLRDIRKRLDGQISAEEVDAVRRRFGLAYHDLSSQIASQIAFDLLEEAVALSSDYIGALLCSATPKLATMLTPPSRTTGNTLIQKVSSDLLGSLRSALIRSSPLQIFERASPDARMALLERIAPHLAAIGFVPPSLADVELR